MTMQTIAVKSFGSTKTTSKVLLICWMSILFEGYDVGVMGAVLPTLAEYKQWNLSPLELGALSSYALVGMFFGAFIIGTLSELYGRRRMLLTCVTLFSLTMLGAAFAPTPWLFGLMRFIGGIGLGGVIPVAAALTIEYSPTEKRSFNYGIMYSGYSLGILSAALVAMWLLEHFGWRSVIAFGALPLLLIWPMARILPESLEYLTHKGLHSEAQALAKKLDIDYQSSSEYVQHKSQSIKEIVAVVFAWRHLRATACFWVALFCGMLLVYGLNTWLPSIMRKEGYNLGSSLTFLIVFSLASALGGLFLGKIADKYGVRNSVAFFFLLGAIGVGCLIFKQNIYMNYVLVAFAGVGSISAALILTGYIANYYPSNARASATGWALSFSRIGAMTGPMFGAYIASLGIATSWNFIAFAIVAVIAATAVILLPKQRAL
ncbi:MULTISPECIES: MFS transporter [Providencia]|uniref:Aromatic acid/H+ symport family MFS transporter n=1 Tax=Providencia rettgeri TaxID=587 RepID=A0A3R8WD41_PRORE|nr:MULTISPECIES: aromatic acid/H+ symport family MFS transporter [Providencia]ELR5071425.1 aromatic acid/H+ symport family MFS transporter [Providencia rettgeri]ELR5217310.1 aromatic acid/H+ symport family MFS transporter [Providencia rettgeri]ELR5223213.1 aromatic acid/H+ symport family MFS transporter [Providencia rettgeri]MBV2189508.1 aromatic acid/H+ symport family MFS transporter [Providencia rettgeri]MDX7323375.1 aromatic acid/H+ symport family MFS transporter [Providencia rettgeri]